MKKKWLELDEIEKKEKKAVDLILEILSSEGFVVSQGIRILEKAQMRIMESAPIVENGERNWELPNYISSSSSKEQIAK